MLPPPSAPARRPGRRSAVHPAGLAALLLALPGCRTDRVPPVIRIGLVTYTPTDLNGPPTTHAVEMALEEANARGGLLVGGVRSRVEVRRVVIKEDSPEQAVAAVQRLINQEKVCAILGPQLSDEAIPAGGVAERSGIPLISPISSHSGTTQDRAYVFRACFRDADQGRVLAELARGVLRARTAALLVQVNVAYSRTVAEVFRREFTALGGRIAADVSFTDAGKGLGPQLAEIRRAAPDVLLLPNFQNSTLEAGRAARRAGIRSAFLGTDAWSRSRLGGVAEFEGAYMVTNWSPDLASAENARFMAEYARRFAAEPSETAALTYDAARFLFAAIGASGDGTPAAIRTAMAGPLAFEGVCGPLRYSGGGDPRKAVVVLRFRAGRAEFDRVIPSQGSP